MESIQKLPPNLSPPPRRMIRQEKSVENLQEIIDAYRGYKTSSNVKPDRVAKSPLEARRLYAPMNSPSVKGIVSGLSNDGNYPRNSLAKFNRTHLPPLRLQSRSPSQEQVSKGVVPTLQVARKLQVSDGASSGNNI